MLWSRTGLFIDTVARTVVSDSAVMQFGSSFPLIKIKISYSPECIKDLNQLKSAHHTQSVLDVGLSRLWSVWSCWQYSSHWCSWITFLLPRRTRFMSVADETPSAPLHRQLIEFQCHLKTSLFVDVHQELPILPATRVHGFHKLTSTLQAFQAGILPTEDSQSTVHLEVVRARSCTAFNTHAGRSIKRSLHA